MSSHGNAKLNKHNQIIFFLLFRILLNNKSYPTALLNNNCCLQYTNHLCFT